MLTEDEIDSLDTCACGHWACEHTIDGCATVIPEEDGGEYQDDYGAYLCPCLSTPEAIRLDAVEALVAARERAWRGRLKLSVMAPPMPFQIASPWRVELNPGGIYEATESRTVTVSHDPTLVKRGYSWGQSIALREWDERVYLHEVLHTLIGADESFVARLEVGLMAAGFRFAGLPEVGEADA